MQIKTTVNTMSHPLGWLLLKKYKITSAVENVEKLESLCIVSENVKSLQSL